MYIASIASHYNNLFLLKTVMDHAVLRTIGVDYRNIFFVLSIIETFFSSPYYFTFV